MAAVVRIKNNRFVRLDLQNKDGKYFSFREIGKPGVLHGYIKGVVQTAYPLFYHDYYGKMRKMILVETRDDDDDDDDLCIEIPIFTRGTVAEQCEGVNEGDFLLLENPFFELSHPQKPNLHIIGDKNCSDICIWNIINNRSRLLVGQEENGCESDIETEDSAIDQEDNCNDDMDVHISDGDVALSIDEATSSRVKKGRVKFDDAKLRKSPKNAKTDSSRGSTDVAKFPRLTRSSALQKNGPSQPQRVTRSTSSRGNNMYASESSQESKDSSASQSERPSTRSAARKTTNKDIVSSPPPSRRKDTPAKGSSQDSRDSSASQSERPSTRSAARKTTDKDKVDSPPPSRENNPSAKGSSQDSRDSSASQSERPSTRSAARKTTDKDIVASPPPSRRNDTPAKGSSQDSRDSSASQSERPSTRSAARKTTARDTVTSPPQKRKRKFHLGPKGSSSSPSNSPELRNVVALETEQRKSPRKEKNKSQPQASNTKIAKNASPLKSTNEIGESSRGSPSLKLHKVPSSSKSSKGTISTESSLENEGKEVGELLTNSQASTPSGTFSSKKQKCFGQIDSTPEAPKKNLQPKSKKAVNATPTKTNKGQASVAGGSPSKVNKDTRNSTQPNIAKDTAVTFVDDDKVPEKSSNSSKEQGKGAKYVVDKSGKPTKDDAVVQPSVNEQSTSAATASPTTSSNAPTISTASSIVPSISTTLSNVPSTSATLTDVPSTSATLTDVPSTSATLTDVPSTSATLTDVPSTSATLTDVPSTSTTLTDIPSTSAISSIAPTTSTTSNVPPQSTSYTVPVSYTKISDVKPNTMCDLYGVAKFFKPPWKSRGTDMCSVVVLADPSSDEPLECVMFKDVILLPQIRRVGDIIRLHRMNIKKYKDKLQAVSTRGFSALVFDGNLDSPVTKEAARVTTGSFTFNEAEKKVVQTLKEWHLSRPDIFEEAKFLTVSTVEPDLYFDIVCQVKGMAKHNNIDCVVLRVTDGTEPKYDIKSCEDDDSYQVVLVVDSHNQSPVFDVFLYGEHASLVMTLDVKADMVLMLHNVHSIATQGGPGASLLDVLEPTLELCIHRGSEYGRGLAVLFPDSDDAQKLLQKLKQHNQTSPRKQS